MAKLRVPVFHLIQLKAAVKCEAAGMKHSSGRSATAHAKRLLGLSRSTSREKVIQTIEDELDKVVDKTEVCANA